MTPLKTVMNNVEQKAHLRQLRDEFELARDYAFDTLRDRRCSHSDDVKAGADEFWYANRLMKFWRKDTLRAIKAHVVAEAARRYIIARDFNEFEPEKADMLWKLQNNN